MNRAASVHPEPGGHPDLVGETVLVLGGAGRIGAAVTTTLAASGAHPVVVDVDPEGARLAADVPGSLDVLEIDVTEPAGYQAVIDFLDARPARYFVAAPSAPIPGGRTRVPEAFEWAASHDVFLYRPAMLARHVMERRHAMGETASAVFIGSVHSEVLHGDASYAAAKAGLDAVARELAAWAAPFGSRSNVVAPGHVSREVRPSPPTRLGGMSLEPRDVAGTVRFLLCDDCSPRTTGARLVVDGGLGLVSPWPHP